MFAIHTQFGRDNCYATNVNLNIGKICIAHKFDHKLNKCGRFCEGLRATKKGPCLQCVTPRIFRVILKQKEYVAHNPGTPVYSPAQRFGGVCQISNFPESHLISPSCLSCTDSSSLWDEPDWMTLYYHSQRGC